MSMFPALQSPLEKAAIAIAKDQERQIPPSALPIVAGPFDVYADIGVKASFEVICPNAVSYQWQKDTGSGFVNISGETNQGMIFTPDQTMLGDRYRVVVTNSNGSTTSPAATLYARRWALFDFVGVMLFDSIGKQVLEKMVQGK